MLSGQGCADNVSGSMVGHSNEEAVIKEVIGNIYETNKMLLEIGDEVVTKLFKPSSGYKSRYRQEKEALLRMEQVDNVPRLIKSEDQKTTLFMSRLPGRSVTELSETNLSDLTNIVTQMLAAGVARHSMPVRDILVDEQGLLSLVDFERSTLRYQTWRPDWIIAKKVTQYHLSRLISQHQPQLLSSQQQRQLDNTNKVRAFLRIFKRMRTSYRQSRK